ncbi:MAG: DoxX family protein [Candidatus Competibacteraceae bacterium]
MTLSVSTAPAIVRGVNTVNLGLNGLAPVAFLVLRCWVAWQFMKSGLTKIQSFSTTIDLFRYEYHVPILPPEVATYLATGAELGCSALLMVGLAGRVNALALFILNIVAVLSYADALLQDHLPWGLILLVFVLHGPDKLSLDHLIGRYLNR